MNEFLIRCIPSFFFLILISGTNGCTEDKQAPVPSYIQVDGFSFQGSGPDSTGYPTQRISDVWMYVNNQYVGTYAIPTGRIPVLAERKARISLQAGIFTDGIRKSRVYYPYYKEWRLDTVLEKEKTIKLRPHFTFMPVWKGKSLVKPFSFYQDFEWSDSGCVKGESGSVVPVREFHNGSAVETLFGKRYLRLSTGSSDDVIDLSNKVYVPLETNGNPVYLEFDYKSTCKVQVGVRGIVGTSVNAIAEDLILTPVENWTKIYVSLSDETARFHSETLSQRKPAYFRFFLRTIPPPGAGNSLCIDNIRLLN